ncbi:CcoQ/FixQ family Cbb3-type cytochrome c oxidase assembly chaperone [Mangrovibacterium diazotrophicum]|uniref:Cbb3-type cytochrome oxidase component FixQ n=1 Tax=Mangrovibacterium diazotrophicum TaxID=1261403 RepID=A0A419W7F2_9BACT|nr:CcoQ/FixQ family Cbb3-type cytochrome c oxidase assembly chaperone [Mangrovibacterium diazotrophicum]RKD91411.1 Cbb3-type cytochrome oxidase component FixQ [Mangrovibacterium diazotrophicum]
MWKEQLSNIEHVEFYAIIGFFIFFVFFVLITIHTMKMDKSRTQAYGNLPLDEEDQNQVEQQNFTL